MNTHPTDVALADYLDNLLSGEDRGRLESHIAGCDECRNKMVCAYESVRSFRKSTTANRRKTKYCVGCELEKTDSELVDGRCPLHPHQEIETIKEENYFFKFSAFQQKLLDLYKSNPDFVVPKSRLNEIKQFTKKG